MQETWYGYSAFQEAIYRREIRDGTEYFLDSRNIHGFFFKKKIHPLGDDLWSWILTRSQPVLPRFSRSAFLNTDESDNNWVSLFKHKELLSPQTSYLSEPSSELQLKDFTHLVVGDLSTRLGVSQAFEVVLRLKESEKVNSNHLSYFLFQNSSG